MLISQEKAYEMMKGDVEILDVREDWEYKRGHIENAKLLSLSKVNIMIEVIVPNKDKEILVYCASGGRSSMAVNILRNSGYTKVYNIGGIRSWPYEIVK